MASAAPVISSRLTVRIAPEVVRNYPDTKVAFLLAKVDVQKAAAAQKTFLGTLKDRVIATMHEKGITPANYKDHAVCQSWRRVFGTFGTGDDKVSTIETLLKRAAGEADAIAYAKAQNKKLPKPDFRPISNFVDMYNYVSMINTTPMGALDLSKVEGDIELRYGKEGETFVPLGRVQETFNVTPKQIVYADSKNVLTWLWNYRDAAHCCVPLEKDNAHILLFADQAEANAGDAVKAIEDAKEALAGIDGQCLLVGLLDASHLETSYDLSRLAEGVATPLHEGTPQEQKC